MLIEACLTTCIKSIIRSCFTKVALDGTHSLLDEMSYLILIPGNRFRITQIKNSILIVQRTVPIPNRHTFIYQFLEIAVLWSEVRQLPETSMESILLQRLEHANRVLETILGKLIITLPVYSKPSSIKVDDIRRNLIGSQLMSYFQSLLLGEIRDTAHPGTKSPQRQHWRLACHVCIFIQDLLRFTKEHEEVHCFITHKEALGTYITCTEIGSSRSRSMHKDTIASIGEIERHRLVHTICFRSLRIYNRQVHLLSHLI